MKTPVLEGPEALGAMGPPRERDGGRMPTHRPDCRPQAPHQLSYLVNRVSGQSLGRIEEEVAHQYRPGIGEMPVARSREIAAASRTRPFTIVPPFIWSCEELLLLP